MEDLQYAIEEGPWIIYVHYLTVRRWFPEFKPSETTIDSTAVWVRFPGLSIQYYNVTMIESYSQWEMPLVRPLKLIRIQALLLRSIFPVFVFKFILINLRFPRYVLMGSGTRLSMSASLSSLLSVVGLGIAIAILTHRKHRW